VRQHLFASSGMKFECLGFQLHSQRGWDFR
jgi:hypothetical protein